MSAFEPRPPDSSDYDNPKGLAMSYRVTLSLPDIEGDNPVMAVEAFSHAAREWEQWQYVVLDEETGLRYDVDMQAADEGGIIYPTLVEGGVRHSVDAEESNR